MHVAAILNVLCLSDSLFTHARVEMRLRPSATFGVPLFNCSFL